MFDDSTVKVLKDPASMINAAPHVAEYDGFSVMNVM